MPLCVHMHTNEKESDYHEFSFCLKDRNHILMTFYLGKIEKGIWSMMLNSRF